jgi:MoxR-like ATPase
MPDFVPAPEVKEATAALTRIADSINQHLRGKQDVVERVLTCLVAGGHLLIEDLPGVGKTTLAYCLARSIDSPFQRIQFTSDLLPSDVLGVSVYDESVKEFVFKRGPIFANFVLADEINRTTPKTQSSLLEVMDRGRVTVDGQTYTIGPPFMVLATQNPVDFEGTFPLPESQMDRFLMRLQMGYPSFTEEMRILAATETSYDSIQLQPVVARADIVRLQKIARSVFVEESVADYLLRVITATRTEAEFKAGVSVRGTLALRTAAQARALLRGRDFVVPEDVADMAMPVLAHRLALRRPAGDPREERAVVEGALRRILGSVAQPT